MPYPQNLEMAAQGVVAGVLVSGDGGRLANVLFSERQRRVFRF